MTHIISISTYTQQAPAIYRDGERKSILRIDNSFAPERVNYVSGSIFNPLQSQVSIRDIRDSLISGCN